MFAVGLGRMIERLLPLGAVCDDEEDAVGVGDRCGRKEGSEWDGGTAMPRRHGGRKAEVASRVTTGVTIERAAGLYYRKREILTLWLDKMIAIRPAQDEP